MSVEMMKLLKSMADDTSTAVLKIHDSPRIKVYPNPATSFLNIEKPGDVSAVVYSLEGVYVAAINDGVQEIDFPAGLYLIVFMDKSGRVETTKKLIIQ
jgi:predicted 3-demethylubiquinone-9 3-methyltransferase (glyoxalase superfamily)